MSVESPERRPPFRLPGTDRVRRPPTLPPETFAPPVDRAVRRVPSDRLRAFLDAVLRRRSAMRSRATPDAGSVPDAGSAEGARRSDRPPADEPSPSTSSWASRLVPRDRPLRSTVAAALPEEDVLYRDGGVVVMPSWLEIDGRESYAVRSIVRLSLDERAPPRAMARAVFVVALVLAVLSGVHLVGGSLPLGIAWVLLAASLALALVASRIAFVHPTEHVLDVHVADGTPIRLTCPERVSLLELHAALSRAMERQRGGG